MNATTLFRAASVAAALVLTACGGGSEDITETLPADQVRAAATPPPPRITDAPQDATVGVGGGIRLSVVAVGQGRLTYRWYKNGGAIVGAAGAGSNYDINSAVAGDAGIYTVRVTDSFYQTSTTSTSAKLVVVQQQCTQLGGRPVQSVGAAQQPSLALCASPSMAYILYSSGRNALYVSYFNGKQWLPYGGVLNATAIGSASEPSLGCVEDGTATRPIVAWSEGSGAARNIYVKVWNGSKWSSVGTGALNAVAGTSASRPTLRTTPQDASTGNTFINGATRRSAVAWIENGVPTVKHWDNGWLPYGAGVQIAGGASASDIALTIELDEQGGTYPPIVAWLADSGGMQQQFAATHNAGLATWVMMGAPISTSSNPMIGPALVAGRIGIGVGKFGQGRTPVAFWADAAAPNNFRSYMYDSGYFVGGTGGQAWPRYGSPFTVANAIKTTAFDPREFRREGANACGFSGNLPTFGWAISHGGGFEVRRGACGTFSSPADWVNVRPLHAVPLEEISLRMAGEDDPYVAGTRLVGGQYQLSVWKFYP